MPAHRPSTLTEILGAAAEVPPSRGLRLVAPGHRETCLSWADLHRRMLFHADHLREQGIEAGQHVVVPLVTRLDVIASFLALIWLGAVPVSIGAQASGQERSSYLRWIKRLLDRYGFDRLLVERSLGEAVSAELGLPPGTGVDPYPADVEREPPRIPPAPRAEDDVAFVQFSSGSVSDPKGVRITHRNVCANLSLINQNDGRTAQSTGVVWLPLSHDMGLVGGFLSPMIHYHSLVLMDPVCFLMKPVSWLIYVSRHRGTVASVPNFAIETCNTRVRDRQLQAAGIDLGSLEYVYNGSEPVSAEAIERFHQRFARYGLRPGIVHPAYGMAESTLMIAAHERNAELVTREVDGVRVVSVGRPQGDFRLRIVDDRGRGLPADAVGEVLVRGSCVTPGYYRDEAENRRRFRDGWLRTGDLGLLDAEGRLFITGRIGDRIVVSGRNFYAHDIAAKIEELPFVRRGKTHVFAHREAGGERIVALAVLVGGAARRLARNPAAWLTSAALSKDSTPAPADGGEPGGLEHQQIELFRWAVKRYVMCEAGLPVHDVRFVARIPRTPSGKIRRAACEALYRECLQSSGGSRP